MSRKVTFDLLKNYNKNGMKYLFKFSEGGYENNFCQTTTNEISIQRRFCHVSNVATPDNMDLFNKTNSPDFRSKILHVSVVKEKGKIFIVRYW